jgi:ribosome modulation factor
MQRRTELEQASEHGYRSGTPSRITEYVLFAHLAPYGQ